MIERGYRQTRPFGHRRAEERPDERGADLDRDGRAGIERQDWDVSAKTAGPLAWALRTAAFVGFAAIFATQYLARVGLPDDVAVTRLAQGGRTGPADPETTGSIGRAGSGAAARPASGTPAGAAQATRLDPCAVAGGGRMRP